MTKIPYRGVFEDLFVSDKSIVLKMFGGAAVGGLFSILAIGKGNGPALSTPVKIAIISIAVLTGTFGVLLLSLRDVVARRVDRGKYVNPLLRAYFGRGNGCLMVGLWSITVIFVTMIVTLLTARL